MFIKNTSNGAYIVLYKYSDNYTISMNLKWVDIYFAYLAKYVVISMLN